MTSTAIIGVSGFGEVHYNDLIRGHDSGLLEIKAATIINQDEEAEKCAKLRSIGCRIFSDHREMLREIRGKVDICFIPTGIHLHAPMTIDCLEAGINVFVEKPLAATVQEVEAMKEAEKRSGLFVAVGYQTIYSEVIAEIKRRLLQGHLGPVKTIKCLARWPRNEAYYARNNWAGKMRIGKNWILDSPFNNALSHQLNMMCFFAGKTFEKSASISTVQAELYRGNDIESADTASIKIKTADGTKILFILSHATESSSGPEMVIECQNGQILWDTNGAVFKSEKGTDEIKEVGWEALRDKIISKLIARLSDKSGFICSLDIAGTQTLCINGAHESSPVAQIPKDLVQRIPDKESFRKVVKGIDSILQECYEKELLISETGVSWGVKGVETDLSNYKSFPQSKHLK